MRTIRWALTSQPAHVEASEGTPARAGDRAALAAAALRPRRAVRRALRRRRSTGCTRAAADLRAGDQARRRRADAAPARAADGEIEPYIRACSLQLQLANIAEERERIRRRRAYDAPGDAPARVARRDRGAPARARRRRRRARCRALHIELVLTAHPTEATRRSVLDHQWDLLELLDRARRPAHRPRSRRRALLDDAARDPHDLVADRRGAPRAPARRGRGAPQPVLLRVDAVRRRARRCFAELERALATRRRAAGALVRLVGRLGHGRPSGGRRRHARAHAAAAPRRRRCGCCATGSRALARRYSHADRRVPLSPALEASLARDAAELPYRRRAAPRPPRVGAAAHQARLRRAPARPTC